MNITDVRVRKVTKEGKMKAVVSITIDDEFVVHDIKVIEGEKGLFIAMPSRKATDGEYRDIAHPINSGTREKNSDHYPETVRTGDGRSGSRGSCCRGLSKKEERMPPGGKRKWLRFPPGGVFVSKNKDDDIQKYIAIFL